MEALQDVLGLLGSLRPGLVYAILGAGAALENVVPPVPADTFVLLGGFLAGTGRADAWKVFAVTWTANVGSALVVYAAGRRYGRGFFAEGWGRHVLDERQLRRMRRFYDRWGLPAIFLTRFLPGLRAVVPAFAGVSRQPFLPVAVPVAVASAVWYGLLVWLGATAGRNLDVIWGWLQGTNRALLGVALVLSGFIGIWWYRTRRGDGAEEAAEDRPDAPDPEPR